MSVTERFHYATRCTDSATTLTEVTAARVSTDITETVSTARILTVSTSNRASNNYNKCKKLQFIHKLTSSDTSKIAKITKKVILPTSTSPKCQYAAE